MEFIRGALSWVDLTIQQLVITLLIVVVYLLYKKIECLQLKYNQHDKLLYGHSIIIYQKLGVKTVKLHRSNDYEIVQQANED